MTRIHVRVLRVLLACGMLLVACATQASYNERALSSLVVASRGAGDHRCERDAARVHAPRALRGEVPERNTFVVARIAPREPEGVASSLVLVEDRYLRHRALLN